MKNEVWGMDYFTFRAVGNAPQRFVRLVAERGIRLSHLYVKGSSLCAQALGRDRLTLQVLAEENGLEFVLIKRRGPGRMMERLFNRPGVIAGIMIFLILMWQLPYFVWTIDFGDLDASAQNKMRQLFATYGIWEGVRLDDVGLQHLQEAASQQSDQFGWISLNFINGCLRIESTPAEHQTIQKEAPMQPLVACESGEIVFVGTQSGFTVVHAGEQVEKGQLLIDVARLDRDGKPVLQGASGEIIARTEKAFTAFQPYEVSTEILTGESESTQEITLLGYTWMEKNELFASTADCKTEWEPLKLGKLSLPGCLRLRTVWEKEPHTIEFSAEQAEALARRNCRQQLFAAFPDAVIESEKRQIQASAAGIECTIVYRFCANIATPQA